MCLGRGDACLCAEGEAEVRADIRAGRLIEVTDLDGNTVVLEPDDAATKRMLVLDSLHRAAGQLRQWAQLDPEQFAELMDAAGEVDATAGWIAEITTQTVYEEG